MPSFKGVEQPTVRNTEPVAEYHRLLSQTQEILAVHREKHWVSVLERWRSELTSATLNVDLRQHAVRTARAMGGIGSISEIALISHDEGFTKLLDALYAICRQIRNMQLAKHLDFTQNPPRRSQRVKSRFFGNLLDECGD
jgi:hypothetical protein